MARFARNRGWVMRAVAAAGAVAFALVAYMYVTLPDVRQLARTNPTSTAFMELRAAEARAEGRRVRQAQRWVPYRRISPHLKRAVIVAEDSAFWEHEGIDVEQIRKALEDALEKGDAPRGASTITQQLAKNLYLSPSRDPLRKLRELIITRRLEAALPKARILEIYLNVVEWGDGIWGAEAASRAYFGVSASGLNRAQAALLAGALINPIRYSPGRPPGRLLRRQQIILSRMGGVEPPPAVATPDPAPEPTPEPVAEAPDAPVAPPAPVEP
jgi:monofunctional biosynthetic peptidoglycan transglycosylase